MLSRAAGRARCAVLVSGGGTNLQALIDASRRDELPHVELSLVLSSKAGVRALQRADAAGIPAKAIPRKDYETDRAFEESLLRELRAARIDLVVLAGFMRILSPDFVRCFPDRILNVHPSLIPAFCGKGMYGLKVHEAALAYGVKVSGATVHLVNEIPDGGRILLQKAVDLRPGDTAPVLQRRIMEEAEWVLLPKALEQRAMEYLEETPVQE